MTAPPRAVFLDVMGTLVDEDTGYKALDAVMGRVAERFALDAKADELSGEFSLALMDVLGGEDPADVPAEFVPFEEAAGDVFRTLLEFRGFAATPEDVSWFWDAYLEEQRKHLRPYGEAKAALDAIRKQGIHVGVLTDVDQDLLDVVLEALRLQGHVDSVTCAEETGYVKPSPKAFLPALERAGVGPEETVMVGHSYERDVLGARAAGIDRGILVDRHRARIVDVPTLPSLKRVPKLLKKELEEPDAGHLLPSQP